MASAYGFLKNAFITLQVRVLADGEPETLRKPKASAWRSPAYGVWALGPATGVDGGRGRGVREGIGVKLGQRVREGVGVKLGQRVRVGMVVAVGRGVLVSVWVAVSVGDGVKVGVSVG